MKLTFDKLYNFFQVREVCIFCHQPMVKSIDTWLGFSTSNLQPVSDVYCIGDSLKFTFNNTQSLINNFTAECTVNLRTNSIRFYRKPDPNLGGELTNGQICDIFFNYSPHLIHYCDNSQCGSGYYLCSSGLVHCSDTNSETIQTCLMFIEGFTMNDTVVQNDWIRHQTRIYNVSPSMPGYDSVPIDPITIPIIKLDLYSKDKLINKIKTIMVFS